MSSYGNGITPPGSGRRSRRTDQRPDLRVGTAERSEVADSLSQHFAEGRLDTTEFNERSEQAMTAKTRADLSTLLADLPGHQAPPVPARRRWPLRFAVVALLVGLVAVATWAASLTHAVWILGVLVLWAALRHHGGHGRGSSHRLGSGAG
jgi:hypothetical protein